MGTVVNSQFRPVQRCNKMLDCGHQCPSLCGEKCPDKSFCKDCDTPANRQMDGKHVNGNVDCDPIIVLQCGHVFSVSTLDGHVAIDSVYVRTGDQFTACLPLSRHEKNTQQMRCPECGTLVHSIRRYGRIIKMTMLRSLERKHLMNVRKGLDGFSRREPKMRSIRGLLEMRQSICTGPMKQVFEACGNRNNQAPTPPSKPLIECLHLLGQSYAAQIDTVEPNE